MQQIQAFMSERSGYQAIQGTKPQTLGYGLNDSPAGQAAWIVPPIANLGNGPAGFAHYPGLGLPERYQNHFFLADYGYYRWCSPCYLCDQTEPRFHRPRKWQRSF